MLNEIECTAHLSRIDQRLELLAFIIYLLLENFRSKEVSIKLFQIQNNDLCSVLMANGTCVGTVCCKYEIVGCSKTLYIMSLGVHPLYRCRGLGGKLLDFVTSKAGDISASIIKLHVQVNNSVAIEFYTKRGFAITETIPNYYHRCTPADAYVMHRVL
ncbi:unnamed protein product [Angiostrongylus costaricensis]|uniref:N-terminal methionine N(alpha)-acetyltransferase NatE n=1 Tax=Angiostrongylus costaricensis TaxID=334426 RepID=A0A0R3PRS7_ANGCS|nr:unnamed protein product [Angiostrongylus costaricensis]